MDDEIREVDIVVIIATKNRPDLLSSRAVKSILSQSKMPSVVVIVDDSDENYREYNQKIVNEINHSLESIYLVNQRTPGASGAWNTGVEWAISQYEKLSEVYISILDDDDEWETNYLYSCIELIKNDTYIDFVASDFYRIEKSFEDRILQKAPEKIYADLFLIGNPGIQGSNLFLRLSTFLEAGGFDENLSSCTDRDLCIRLCDLSDVNYTRNPKVLMKHYAEPQRERLSSPNSINKKNGLNEFWEKYRGRMAEDQKINFCSRAKMLFNWVPQNKSYEEKKRFFGDNKNLPKSRPSLSKSIDKFNLYIGVITSDINKMNNLILSLGILDGLSCLSKLEVTVLCNGIEGYKVRENIRITQNNILSIDIIDEKTQSLEAKEGLFGESFKSRPMGVLGIAQCRTMVQKYVGIKAKSDSKAISWILDDDMRIDHRALNYIPWLPEFKKEGVDILLGCYEGSSPNPPLNGLRILLVDLFHNILWLKGLEPNAKLPVRSVENDSKRTKYADYYYDLSRKHSGHLEAPHWIEPEYEGEIVQAAYTRLVSNAPLIVTGHPLTRSIQAPEIKRNPLDSSFPSVNRGGTTFILNSKALLQVPNLSLKINGREARRSDMMWAFMNKHIGKMNIRAVAFPILHDGRVNPEKSLNIPKVVDEIIGSAIYAGLGDFLKRYKNHTLIFSENEINEILEEIIWYRNLRLNKLKESNLRIMGLTKALSVISSDEELGGLLSYLSKSFSLRSFEEIKKGVLKMESENVKSFLRSLHSESKLFADSDKKTEINE